MNRTAKVGVGIGAAAALGALFVVNQADHSSLGAYLAPTHTESLFVKAGGGEIRGTFHQGVPLTQTIASLEARYGIVFATTTGNTVGEREALDSCIMGKLGFPEGYVITQQDHSDARIVARPGGRAAWDADPIRSAAIACAGPTPPEPPICPVCPDCPEPPPCPPAPPACDPMTQKLERFSNSVGRWTMNQQREIQTWMHTCPAP